MASAMMCSQNCCRAPKSTTLFMV